MTFEPYLRPVVDRYVALVDWIATTTGFEDKLLHVHAGLLILLLARLVLRRPFSSPIPLACVALAELINEIFDRLNHGRWMPDTGSDVINTLFWPVMILLIERLRATRGRRR